MGHQASIDIGAPRGSTARLRPLPPSYTALCDALKAGDAAGGAVTTTDEIKDALSKILEFTHAMRCLPPESEVSGTASMQSPEQQMHEITSSVDSVNDLFQYIANLAATSTDPLVRHSADAHRLLSDAKKDIGATSAAMSTTGVFDARVGSYVRNLQGVYQLTKKEKYRFEQRLLAARMQAASQRKVNPPPLPLPTQNCMTMGWDLVVHLLRATRADNPQHYVAALEMIKESLLPLKPTTYSDSMYLAPSASAAFNILSDCLGELAQPIGSKPAESEERLGAATIEALAEVGLARGSLATMLSVVSWLMKQKPSAAVNFSVTLSKLAALKEQPMYGKCEASGELYCCGQNSYGELGVGDDIERHQLTSVSMCGWDDIRQIVSGNETLAVLTNDGVVLTCGLNKSGQCGQGHFDERVILLRPVQALRSQRVKFIAASNGCEHMIALTETGLAYSWGYNDRGQLGHENLTTKIHIPKLIESMKDKKLAFTAVSYHHSALVTDAGELYTFGMNDCGQLGLDHTQHMATPQHVKALEGHEVSMVSCGLYHTIICTASGELLACGKNDYGQLGLGHSRQVKVPTLAPLPNEMICFVACGYYHSIAISTAGRTFSFGRNDYGQLGIGSKVHQNMPNVVALSANTRMVRGACGCYHTVLLSEQGQVFVFGRNNKGQLGNRGSADSLLPVPLKVRPEKNARRCIDVAAGFYTTSLIVERKRENDDGDSVVLDQSCIVSICGRVDIDRSGEIEGLSNFGSISTVGVALFQGKWFYEVEVVTSGLIQIGWIDGYFQGSSDQGEGVGDHAHSWSYDGNRQRRWNSGSSSYGEKWKAGDVIGCLLDLTTREMTFFRNGINLGAAYSEFTFSPSDKKSGLMPGISLERGEIIRVNLGHQPFAYPPTIAGDFDSISRAIVSPTSSAVLKAPGAALADAVSYPPALEGSASVVVKNVMFVVGGSVVDGVGVGVGVGETGGSSVLSNHVWAYHLENKRWERWSDFPIGIRHHQVVAIDDSQILVIGGESHSPSSRHMDLYKCSTLKNTDGSLPAWELIQGSIGAATSLPQPRAFHTAASIRVRLDSMVFMYGGRSTENEVLGDAWYLSLEDYSWSRLPSSLSLDPGPRLGCASTVIGECVYVFGGQDKEDKFRADLWRYNTFDRQWHLCHDDNISSLHDTAGDTAANHGRSEFNPVMPDARVHYSICADLGNVWVFGGANRSGELLNDLWCYSVTAQKWTPIELSVDDGVEGWSNAAMFVFSGTATALYSASDSVQSPRADGNLHLFGGSVKVNGVVSVTSRLCSVATVDSTRAYGVDLTKNVSTSGKATHILGILRAKCMSGASKTTQHCVHEALDSAICMLSHIDRIAGNDIPAEDSETIQLSRCTYRSLCIDPKEKTFSALLLLLESITDRFVSVTSLDTVSTSQGNLVVQVLYPLLVTIRILKLNFFELSRCCLDTSEIGLSPQSTAPGGVLHTIRELLFRIAEHSPAVPNSGEILWFYHAVKQETASSIYYGFSTLFPSLLDRIQVMNRLLGDASSLSAATADQHDSSPTKKLLVPMLIPCFTSAKMLFQLMSESPLLFEMEPDADKHASTSAAVIVQFMDTLLTTLWKQTLEVLDSADDFAQMSAVVKAFEALESGNEFKCLNVFLRAAIYWCSHHTRDGWFVVQSACAKFVQFTTALMQRASSLSPSRAPVFSCVIQNTFPGKLLPFTLLSVLSLPAIRELLPSLLDGFWPQLEQLAAATHVMLKVLDGDHSGELAPTASLTSSEHDDAVAFDLAQPAQASAELRNCLSLPTDAVLTYRDILQSIWTKAVASPGFKSCKVRDTHDGNELHRVSIPSELAALFGTESLLVEYISGGDQDAVTLRTVTFDSGAVAFMPSRTLLSQQIYPLSSRKEANTSTADSSVLLQQTPREQLVASPSSAAVAIPVELSDAMLEESSAWLRDLQKILVWAGSHYAATLITGTDSQGATAVDARWAASPLFHGGLMGSDSDIDVATGRNEVLLQQIVDNVGPGKKLVERVRNALDPTAGGSNNLHLKATRLKRQDSVDAAIEKSGGYEIVDRAVRSAFAVLLKHSNVYYIAEPLSRDGVPSEAIVDAWRSALQLRRWIVREQQKLAALSSEKAGADNFTPEALAKERQQALYSAVCEPIIGRALLLLQLSPAPIATPSACSSPIKLLPGISTAPRYDFTKSNSDASELVTSASVDEQSARQLKKLMETKSTETIEEEDERVQLDIFSFLQQSSPPRARDPIEVADDGDTVGPRSRDDVMKSVLEAHRERALMRLRGVQVFLRLLECSDAIPSARLHMIPVLSSAFKRLAVKPGGSGELAAAMTVKVHFLQDLEFAGARLSSMIGDEFFCLLSALLTSCVDHLDQIKRLVQAPTPSPASSEPKRTLAQLHRAIHDMLLVLEVCCVPYRPGDWERIERIKLPLLLIELTSWSGWKSALQLEVADDMSAEHNAYEKPPILPAGAGSRCPKIICSRNVTIGTDLHKLTLTHKGSVVPDGSLERAGGLAVFDKPLRRGQWYWEVCVRSQSDAPVFVGVTSGAADLNVFDGRFSHGIYLNRDAAQAEPLPKCSIRWRGDSVLGVVLDCDEQKLEFFNAAKRVLSVSLGVSDRFASGYYPTIAVRGAEVCLDLSAAVPPKLWSRMSGFTFPTAVVSGGLVAAPIDGSTISWDGKRRGRHLQLSSGATAIVAGDSSAASKGRYETIVASQGFDSGMIFVEMHVLCPGKDGRVDLGFGIVGAEFAACDQALASQASIKWDGMLDESWTTGVVGVLFDFDKACVVIYVGQSEPAIHSIDAASLRKPLFPALSTLCNGTVLCANFHPHPRPELPPSTCHAVGPRANYHLTPSNELQVGKILQLQVHSCDGGEFSSSHAAKNCLLDDSSVFSSAKGCNVNVVLRHEVDTPFCLSYGTIRGPGPGYSSPVRHAIVFVTSNAPDLTFFEAYNDMTPEEFAALPFPPPGDRVQRDERLPIAYFVLDGSCAQISKQLAHAVTGRYVLVKLLCPASGTNIDVGYVGFCGVFDRENGPAYSEHAGAEAHGCDECKQMPLRDVYYTLQDDDTVKLCASCYDDNRGSLDASYYAITAPSDGIGVSSNEERGVLCAPRRAWHSKTSALLDVSKKAKPSITTSPVFEPGLRPAAALGSGAAAVSEHLPVAAFDDCELFSCGQNNYGELCLGHCNSTSKLEHVPFFSAKSVRSIVGGNEVLAVVMKDGAVFTCGLNKSGQCGNGTFEERVILATPVRALSGIPINMIAAANGCEHMIAVASDGAVYSWGYNDRGQLGLGSTISKSHTPRLVEPLREKYHIVTAAVSYHHSAVVSSAGELLTFGMNDCGQLGLDHTQHQHTPQLVDALSSQVIAKVACGLYHTVAVTVGGEVYAFGKNDYGQLGLGHARNVKVPSLVKISASDSDEKIVDVSCGYYHTVVVTERGKLITWGRNDYGQLGIGSKDHKNAPQYVPLPLSSKIKTTSCGCYHTLILLANGRVMVFGRNNKGQLGAGARTLPSADLPLPVPSNALANDDVVCIAAGFYSSYILTGRSSQGDAASGKDDSALAKDLPEHSCLATSEALYESLMKEMDRHAAHDATPKRAPITIKRSGVQRKLPLVKLHAAAWALTRALMYQSLRDRAIVSTSSADDRSRSNAGSKRALNPVLRMFIAFVLENLKLVQAEAACSSIDSLDSGGGEGDASISLRSICVGVLKRFSSRATGATISSSNSDASCVDALDAHLYRNQLLWVLLRCGAVNSDVSAIIANSADVTQHVVKVMNSSDLPSATLCIQLAMLIFPLHSISSLNRIHRSLRPAPAFAGDIMSSLLLLVGHPLVLRPRLCAHELGIECSSSALCHHAKCLKGVCASSACTASDVQTRTLEKSHVAAAKASEALSLIRYLALYPSWKVAVNATLSRGFAKAEKISELLDTVCAYYANVESVAGGGSSSLCIDIQNAEPIESSDIKLTIETTSVRKPESTSSPEIDDSVQSDVSGTVSGDEAQCSKDSDGVVDARDKKSLMHWQKAKDALDALATIFAAISIVGGSTEVYREGGFVGIDESEGKRDKRTGVLVAIKHDARAESVASVMVCDDTARGVEAALEATPAIVLVPVKSLQIRERVPAIIRMFDNLEGIVAALATLVVPVADEGAAHAELEQPQNSAVHGVLRAKLAFFKKQIQWRATKALASLLQQMPVLTPALVHSDSQLIANLAALLASENALANASALAAIKTSDGRNTGTTNSDDAGVLQNRWVSLKQRQICLDTESVIDSTLDSFEASVRDEVVSKLGKENALSWGIDAIQSPRRTVASFPGALKTMGGSTATAPGAVRLALSGRGRNTADLPFGVWGVLQPLPQLNESESGPSGASGLHAGVDMTPFHLSSPIVRVGRAADSCDLIVNDRSVSGRHFHLRRVRHDGDATGSDEYFELQDFSKNGTIVNGVRVHGTSVRVTPGSRISLILSRGGLVTYEFHARAAGGSRLAPPPIITAAQHSGELNIMIPGQEYQQPQLSTPGVVEPRSPAEIQNRGTRASEPPLQISRNRVAAAQGLRLITSIAESEVPRALISPNPAVDSPRVGGFNSPRSSVLQAPGTPSVGSPTASMYQNMVPPGVLSPASYQQRDSFSPGEAATGRGQESTSVSEALRIALGRESVNRESAQRHTPQGFFTEEAPRTRVMTAAGGDAALLQPSVSSMRDAQDGMPDAAELLVRLRDTGYQVTKEQCEQALRVTEGDLSDALAFLQANYTREPTAVSRESFPPSVRHLASTLGKSEELCAEALRLSDHNVGVAVRLLLSARGEALERSLHGAQPSRHSTTRRNSAHSSSDAARFDTSAQPDAMLNYHELMDENPSYALSDSSAAQAPQRPGRPSGSPHKSKAADMSGDSAASETFLWSECNSCVDDRVRAMNTHEVEQEEETLSQLLTAVHARKALSHIVRLCATSPGDSENSLSPIADRTTLRQLVTFTERSKPTSSSGDISSSKCDASEGSVQRILSRMATAIMNATPALTLSMNLRAVDILSTLVLSVDCSNLDGVSTPVSGCEIERVVHALARSEAVSSDASNRSSHGEDFQLALFHDLMFDTLLYIISRTLVVAPPSSLHNWDTSMARSRRTECLYPKGPIHLSSGLECMVVNTYERVWSVPSPDPLLKYRHKWRRRQAAASGAAKPSDAWARSDHLVTIWRPTLPPGLKLSATGDVPAQWFSLGDVINCGSESPEAPIVLVSDAGCGLLLPPVGFERVDVTGKGLPRNSEIDDDLQRKQLRSIWWPIAPSGYVAMGCVAGSKEDPFEPPALSSTRCVREDLVQRVRTFRCVWKAEANAGAKLSDGGGGDEYGCFNTKNQSDTGPSDADDVVVQTSLWCVSGDYCAGVLPVITLSESEAAEPSVAFTLSLSEEDKILCAPVGVSNVLTFVDTLVLAQKALCASATGADSSSNSLLRPELAAGLFALVQQVLREKTPSCGQLAVDLVRALIKVVRSGGTWDDTRGLLYCRSKIMALSADQDGGLMLNALLQALVELMLVVEEQNRSARVTELTACLGPDANISLPYRYHFARHGEMLVSHSSKMAMTRHFAGEERKFLLEYRADDANNPPLASAQASGDSAAPLSEFYSCRFEHTPALVMTMQDIVKAEIVYFEVTIVEWSSSGGGVGAGDGAAIALGFSTPEFALEGAPVGFSTHRAHSFSFTPVSGKVQGTDLAADHWRWSEHVAAVTCGDIFGCGLRLDTDEIFFTKNGQLLGTAFSSIDTPQRLHPTLSVNADCKFLINFGQAVGGHDTTSTTTPMSSTKAAFAFRFSSMDCDNLMAAFEWYEHLSQVYGVMRALMDPARDEPSAAATPQHLPNEFMLSADNFLSEISEDVCIRVESAHPYDLELQEALVSIPLATSIRVKLDQQCETANSHCLQILQGGESAESSESEVRAFTGACGGQEVMIDGDSFVWSFPVQSNFQCRVDRVRKGPYLKLEHRDTRLSLARDKGWQTAIGVARFDSGVHIWEVRISFVTASSNIFLGIARKDVRLDSYLGKDNRGWGWIGNRALWHNGSKQRGTYGEKFKTGDVVKMTLDLKRGTLSYALNGKDLGVAFGPGGTGPKLEGTFYPGFALYNQRDSIDLIGGHRVEDGSGDALLLSSGSGLLAGMGDDAYYSEDEGDGVGESGDDGAIPNFRLELATALSQMGFPMDWCVYALRHCDDDAEAAADFILANMHAMDALVREEAAEAFTRQARQLQLQHLREVAAAATVSSTATEHALEASDSGNGLLSGDDERSAAALGGVDDSAGSTGDPQSASVDKWGVAFTAVPEFSVTGRRLLAAKYSDKLAELHASQRVFTREHDEALVAIVNEICEARAEALLSCDPLRMAPEDFVPTDEHLRAHACLRALSLAQLQKRFLILRNLNCRLQNSLAFIDLSVTDDDLSVLAAGARALRGVIFQHVKLAWWLSVLKEQQSPAAARPEIEVDRHRARDATETTGVRESVFAQAFDQLHALQPSLLRGADRAFKCQFVGEFGDDFGGLYRECLAQISSELQSKTLPLLTPCPNAVSGVGENREVFVPNAARSDARLVHMAEFLGKLVGIAIRTKTPLDLTLPSVFWKALVRERVTRRDIESIHQGCFQVVDTIYNIDAHGISEDMFDEIVDSTLTVRSSARELVELVPGGKHVRVTWDDKLAYARGVEAFRLREFEGVCSDIARGVATILPAPTLALFTWRELRTLVCGKATVDVDLLRRRTIYGDGCQATDPHIAFFWDVLGEFSDEQKSSFLRFVWGRSRLPTHAADFTQDFKISGLPKAAGRADIYLPIAHTCFFSIDLPTYSSRDVMRDKLLYAITHCQSIDADNTTVAQRAGQGLNWTATTAVGTATTTAAAVQATASAAVVSSVIAGITAIASSGAIES